MPSCDAVSAGGPSDTKCRSRRARASSASRASCTSAPAPADERTTTSTSVFRLGNAAVSRCRVWVSAIEVGSEARLSEVSRMPSAGSASRASAPTEIASVRAGWVSDGRNTPDHSTGSRSCVVHRHSSGTRGRSIARPSATSIAGRTVSEPSTATATTRIDPVASDAKTTLPLTYRPSMASTTATPETQTLCPEVSAAISTASRVLRPARRSALTRLT